MLLGSCHSEPLPGDDGTSSVADKTDWRRCDTSAACSGRESCVCGFCASACEPHDCAARGGVCLNATAQRCVTQMVDSSGACLPSDVDSGWTGSASSSSLVGKPGDPLYNPPKNALDGDPTTTWSSGKPQAADEWYQLDFGQTLVVQSLDRLGRRRRCQQLRRLPAHVARLAGRNRPARLSKLAARRSRIVARDAVLADSVAASRGHVATVTVAGAPFDPRGHPQAGDITPRNGLVK